MKTIYIYSASDRINYGDLLFPIILKQYLSSKGNFKFEIVGNTKSDLTKFGALKTKSYKTLFRSNKNKTQNVLVVAGGEVLSANWAVILSFISPCFFEIYHRLPIKSFLNKVARLLIGNNKELQPYVLSSDFFLKNYSLIYNSVGGSISDDSRYIKNIKKSIGNAIYASFRDIDVADQISQITGSEAILCPDSAIIMTDYYEDDNTSEYSNYIIFQVGYYKSLNNLDNIAKELIKLQEYTKQKILLLPIGNCSGHRDSKALKKLEIICKSDDIIFINPNTINEIMKFIANSNLFIGTSLHGVITAMAFNIPYLGLNPRIKKLDNYLKTWAILELNKCIEFNVIYEEARNALKVPCEILKKNSQNQKMLVYKSLDTIISKIEKLV